MLSRPWYQDGVGGIAGGLCVGVSKAVLKTPGAAVGDEVHLSTTSAPA
jgi:hypothetical protein